uniref:Integrase catalytic domain-containing protein n=1 Tax=Strigamia maritima TaxID=126957 RepID=T1IQB0_STRMM
MDWLQTDPENNTPWPDVPTEYPKLKTEFTLNRQDYATGWIEVVPLRNAKILTLVPHIMRFFQTYGVPRYIVSDNGKQFVSDIYKALCENAGIIPNCTSPFNPQTNYTERINKH